MRLNAPYNPTSDPDASTQAVRQGQTEASDRFYRLGDKVDRADILAHAYAVASDTNN